MFYKSLRDFIAKLEKKNLLIRVKERVSTHLEITEISKRMLEKNGPAILFENVVNEKGDKFSYPVLTNLFASKQRVALGMKVEENELTKAGEILAFLKQPEPPASIKEAYELMPMAKKVLAMKPKMVNKAPCQEIVKLKNDINLFDLPIQECWPNEPAPLITWGLVATKEPSFNDSDEKMTGSTNLGVYRMQVKDKNKLLMRWLKHRGGAQHFKKWQEINGNKPMPCAVVIGCDPATILSAVTPVPDNLSEYLYSGLLRDKKLELVKCKTIPLEVPANAEIILEGFIYPDKLENEGPYGDHTGYYNSVEKFPTFELSAITMRKDPIYLSTYTGKPIDEPSIISLALNEVFTPLIIQQFPEIIDFYLPPEGCSYRIAVVSIKKTYAGQAKRIMMGIWSYLRQFLYTKYIIVVDGDINIRDWKEIMWAISTKTDPSRDMIILDDTPIDYLDFASVKEGLGGKMGIDATNKIFPETTRQWGDTLSMDNKTIKKIDEIWDKIAPEEL